MDVGGRLHAGAPAQVGRDHVRLHRTRAEQGDVDDQVLPPGGLELLQQLALAGRFDLETAQGVRTTDQFERLEVVERDAVQVDLLAGGTGDLVEGVPHRREHAHPQDVELEVAQHLDVVLVGLDHAVTVRAAFQGNPFDQVVAGEHDAAGVQRDVPREPRDPLGDRDQQLHLLELQVDALQFGQVVDRLTEVARRDVRERLRDGAHFHLGQAQRFAYLADRRARPVGVDHRDARRALLAVAAQDHVVDVLAAGRFDVDVDVGQILAHRVHEALERQVVAQRVDVGDADQVAHERTGGAATARGPDAHGLHVGDDLGDGEEVRREPHAPDHRELVVQAFTQGFGLGHATVVDATPAAFGQQGFGAASLGRREVREVDAPQPQIERAAFGDLEGRVTEVGTFSEQRTQVGGWLEPPFGVGARDVGVSDRHDAAHALQRVGDERVGGLEVADRIGGYRPDVDAFGEAQHRPDLGVGAAFAAGARRR